MVEPEFTEEALPFVLFNSETNSKFYFRSFSIGVPYLYGS